MVMATRRSIRVPGLMVKRMRCTIAATATFTTLIPNQ
jgi:hypothetical protein